MLPVIHALGSFDGNWGLIEKTRFQVLPYRGISRVVVFCKMLNDKFFLCPVDFVAKAMYASGIDRWILEKRRVHEPKGPIGERKAMDNLTPKGNLYMLDRTEYQASECHIKVVEADDVFESTAGFEFMGCFISFHRTPIVGKLIVTNVIELMKGEGVIFYNEPPAL